MVYSDKFYKEILDATLDDVNKLSESYSVSSAGRGSSKGPREMEDCYDLAIAVNVE